MEEEILAQDPGVNSIQIASLVQALGLAVSWK